MTQINFEDAAAWADEPIPAEYTPGVAPWKWKPEIIYNASSTLKFLLAENARLQARLDSRPHTEDPPRFGPAFARYF